MAPVPAPALAVALRLVLLVLFHLTCLGVTGTGAQQGVRQVEVCQNDFLDLTCSPDRVLVFTNGSFGWVNSSACTLQRKVLSQGACTDQPALDTLNNRCFNQSLCQIQAAISVFGNPCPAAVSLSLKVSYTCVLASSVSSVCLTSGQPVSVSGTGVLVSPSYPGPSPGDLTCSATLLPPDGQFLQLILLRGSLTHPTCRDRLTLTTPGDGLTVPYQYCSDIHSIDNQTEYRNLTITWTTASNSTGAHFIVQYQVKGCKTADIPIPQHAHVQNYTYGLLVTFACSVGYTLKTQGLDRVECLNDSWIGDLDICEPMLCDHPGGLDQGVVEPEAGALGVGEVLQFSCLTGYQLDGNTSSTCLADGTWSSQVPLCTEVSCSPLATIPNGQVKFYEMNGATFAQYNCIEGFRISGDATLQCLGTGEWIGEFPSCIRIVCRHPGIPGNGSADPQHISDYPIDTVVSFQCDEGYILQGKESISCTGQGDWTDDMPTCQTVVDCGPPPGVDRAEVEYGDTAYLQEASYSCLPGFALLDHSLSVVHCTSNGTWEGTLPTCILAPTTEAATTPSESQTTETTEATETTTQPTTSTTFPTSTTVVVSTVVSSSSLPPEVTSAGITSMLDRTTQEEDSSSTTRSATVSVNDSSLETPTAQTNSSVGPLVGSAGLQKEAIAGIAAGSAALFLIILWIVFVTYWKRSNRKGKRGRSHDQRQQPTCREDSVTELVERTNKNSNNGFLPNGKVHHDHYEPGSSRAFKRCPIKARIDTLMGRNEKDDTVHPCMEDLSVKTVPASPSDTNPNQSHEPMSDPTNGQVPQVVVQNSPCDNQPGHRISSTSSNGSIKHKHKHGEDLSRLSVNSIPSSSASSQRASTNL